jgi:hypothetical protein
MEIKSLQLSSSAASADPRINHGASIFILNHPEVAFDNSLDLTDAEILAKGDPSIVLLSEAKRFTLYADSVKSSPRFKDIVSGMHAADPSTRTVRSLLHSLLNYELSISGKDDLEKERTQNPNYKKDIKAYLASVHGTNADLPYIDSKERKSVHFTEKESSHDKSGDRRSKWPKNQSEVRDGDVPYCKNHPKFKSHWTWECSATVKDQADDDEQQETAENYVNRSRPTGTDLVGGCFYCYTNPKLFKNCMNHTWANCHFDPRPKSANHLNLKNNSKRPRQEEEVAEETSDSSRR